MEWRVRRLESGREEAGGERGGVLDLDLERGTEGGERRRQEGRAGPGRPGWPACGALLRALASTKHLSAQHGSRVPSHVRATK